MSYAADTLFDLEKEQAEAKNGLAKLINSTCGSLSEEARARLIDVVTEEIGDEYHGLTSPLEAELDEAAMISAEAQNWADRAAHHRSVL